MKCVLVIVVTFMVFQAVVCDVSTEKCGAWMKIDAMKRCCDIPDLIEEEKVRHIYKNGNLTLCAIYEKMSETLNLKSFDKTVFKAYLKKTINESDWQPIFDKSVDICMDFVPKILPSFAKTYNMAEDGCGLKLVLSLFCWTTTAFLDCPAKYFTDSSKCKETKEVAKECHKNPDEIIKVFNSWNKQ
ncbi:general odorant-binding protein 68-like [Chironomus tepperi]|uniref:general odorant-binding protein 68-like n=1 Tax=Chironomus tepperi TaxID=113505 RepID=UPI00391F8D01